ncbi:hypothetical protein B0H10DRAFT_214777 [Mycena sp. CBHHK59/15]|nr:hypothetical protein B0H10DRAFT_214777 [Mycena sp. CBHHK59/15]
MRPKSAYEGEQDQSQVTPTPTATILSLPDELLLLIAAIGLEDARLPFGFNWLSPRLEWTMSHVSRRFRNVITSAPTLWTQIEVDLPCPGSAEIFKTYLARSQACKIWVTLRDISQESYQNPIPISSSTTSCPISIGYRDCPSRLRGIRYTRS